MPPEVDDRKKSLVIDGNKVVIREEGERMRLKK